MLQSKARLLELNAKLAETLTSKGVTATGDETTTALIDKVKNISGSEKLIEFSQVRPEVQDYLDNVTYDPTDYTTSQIANYITEKTQNIPNGASVDIAQNGTLVISDTSSKIMYCKLVEIGTQNIYNVTPNSETPFNVIADGKIIQSGLLKPSGTCRMINCPTINNMRDLGGWSCDGGTVKYGKLYRGGQVYEGAYDVFVNQLGIRHELNLRGKTESTEHPSPIWSEVGYTCPTNYVWYTLKDKSTWKQILNCIFDNVVGGKPLFFHCLAGADRTATVACVIEAILGVSQSDIDKDYELTCFNTGVYTDALARRRNETEWQGLINEINAYEGSTFMYKAINFVKSCDISVSKINAFRQAMINGTPETIPETSYSVTKNATLCTITGNDTAVKNSTYTATVTANEGYKIDTVTVTMGGTDITSSAYTGGNITISNVSGEIIINAVAVEDITMVNKMVVKSLNIRLNSSGAETSGNGCFVCEPIEVDLTRKQPVIFKNFASSMGVINKDNTADPSYGNSKIALLDESQNVITHYFIGRKNQAKVWYCPTNNTDCVGDLTDLLSVAGYDGTIPTAEQVKYVKFAPSLHPFAQGAITSDDLNGLEIQMRK